MSDGLPVLLEYKLRAEMELAHKPVTILVNALRGIASCGTACKSCQMHAEIAAEALEMFNATSAR
jgi:hypothetical protein